MANNTVNSETLTEDDSAYQVLSEIQTSMSSECDYEYPIPLDRTPMSSFKDKDRSQRGGSAPRDILPKEKSSVFYTTLPDKDEESQVKPIPPTEGSDSDYSDTEVVDRRPNVIRQVHVDHKPLENGASVVEEDDDDDKIIVEGNLIENQAPLSFKSHAGLHRSASQVDELTESLANQGIYQGLVMTDTDKQRLGIVPESIYMTTNLLQNWSKEIEKMAVEDDDQVEGETISSFRSRKGSNTDPLVTGKKIKRRQQRSSAPQILVNSSTPRSVIPRYRNHVVRPPPLPPLIQQATRAECKAYGAAESLLKSEASFLSSLHTAIQVYMNPLREMSLGPSPILNQQQVAQLFGPIEHILATQEVFYSALTSRTLTWHTEQKIGDIFLSSLDTKEVIRQYSSYVNNFTKAMSVLEQSFNKKPKFESFLRDRYQQSNTSLSLQGLLLKPIQRFPQYILFIQDLLKYTPHTHPDRITLQMALARFEGIANYLNESKRIREQRSIVEFMSSRVSKLPFKLTDCRQRWLHRQDVVTRLFVRGSKVTGKKRCLFLFNNMVLCAAPSNRRSNLESSTGSRVFRSVEGSYTCKWYSPVDQFQIIEPDYHNDIWDQFVGADITPECAREYQEIKACYQRLEHDYIVMTRIANSVSTFHEEYEGLTVGDVTTHIRVLQRKLARAREEITSRQTGRLDISIPSRDGSKRVNHTYMFQNEKTKMDWIGTLRYTKLKLSKHNTNAWVTSEDTNDEDFFDLSHKLPLFVESFRLSMIHTLNSVRCGTRVGLNSAWLASGDHTSAQIMIVECMTPTPLILESFNVDSSRIMDMVCVPSVTQDEATMTSTLKRMSIRDTLRNMGTLTSLPPHLATVWLGGECGRLTVYSAESIDDGTKKCLSSIKFPDAITTIQYHKDQVIVTTAEGNVIIFQRNSMGWNLMQRKTIHVYEGAIRCTCLVKNRLWIGAKNLCHILNLQTHRIEGTVEMSNKPEVFVSRMVCCGEGVWVSFKGSSTLELFHTVTKISLQHIDIKSTMNSIIKRRDLQEKYPIPDRVHVTALMASSGFFWIGTSAGIIMVYRVPLIEGIPLVTAKPYLAMDGHKASVRVILTVMTSATMSSTRVGQFLSAEQRSSGHRYMAIEEQGGRVREGRLVSGGGSEGVRSVIEEEVDGDSLSPIGSPVPAEIGKSDKKRLLLEDSGGFVANNKEVTTRAEEDWSQKSSTPSLPNPSTFELEASVYDDDIYTPEQSDEDEVEINDATESTTDGQGVENGFVDTTPQNIEGEGNSDVESTPGVESIPETNMDESLDYLEEEHYEISREFNSQKSKSPRASIPPAPPKPPRLLTPSILQPDDDPPTSPHIHYIEDLEESVSSMNGDYASLEDATEMVNVARGIMSRTDTVEAVGKHRAKDIYLANEDSIDSSNYDSPHELNALAMRRVPSDESDSVTMRRVPSDELIARMKQEGDDKDDDGSAFDEPCRNPPQTVKQPDKPNPYEDPATLDRAGPLPTSQLFSATMWRETTPTVPGRPQEPKEGATFVLTAGRGLIDLRPGRKTNVLFPTYKSPLCLDAAGDEGCMIAWEIER